MLKSAEQVFVEYLRENGFSLTPQRKIIVETFLQKEGHFSAEKLCELVREKSSDIGQATVYRTLKLLTDSGLADTIDSVEGSVLYEHAYGHQHHDHLICLHCNKKIEILDPVIEERQERVASEHNFKLTRHKMYLYGVCSECAAKKL